MCWLVGRLVGWLLNWHPTTSSVPNHKKLLHSFLKVTAAAAAAIDVVVVVNSNKTNHLGKAGGFSIFFTGMAQLCKLRKAYLPILVG